MPHMFRRSPLLMVALSTPFSVFASIPTFAAEKTEQTLTAPSVMLGQVFLALVLVVGLILAMAWVLKKLGHGAAGHSRHMRVLAALPLGTREKAVLVQVGDQQMMLGVAPGRVNCLHVFDEPVITPPEPGNSDGSGDFASRFKDVLAQRMGR